MRKLKKILPYAAALLIVALCFGAMEASRLFLDYKNLTEEIDLTNSSPMFSLTDDNTPLFPWDVYEHSTFLDSAPESNAGLLTGEFLEHLIYTFSPEVEAKLRYDFQPSFQCGYSAKANDILINYVKGLSLQDASGTRYVINAAYTDYMLLYYSCTLEKAAAPDYSEVKAGYETLKSEYEIFRNDVKPIMDISYEAEADGSDTDENYPHFEDGNIFDRFIARTSELDAELSDEDAYGFMPLSLNLLTLIVQGQTSGVKYNGAEMTMDFFSEGQTLTLFYDPVKNEITGFSYQPKL